MYVEMRRGEKDMEYERAQTSIIQNTINLQALVKKNIPSNGVQFRHSRIYSIYSIQNRRKQS
jgi:hypothetical protein